MMDYKEQKETRSGASERVSKMIRLSQSTNSHSYPDAPVELPFTIHRTRKRSIKKYFSFFLIVCHMCSIGRASVFNQRSKRYE